MLKFEVCLHIKNINVEKLCEMEYIISYQAENDLNLLIITSK